MQTLILLGAVSATEILGLIGLALGGPAVFAVIIALFLQGVWESKIKPLMLEALNTLMQSPESRKDRRTEFDDALDHALRHDNGAVKRVVNDKYESLKTEVTAQFGQTTELIKTLHNDLKTDMRTLSSLLADHVTTDAHQQIVLAERLGKLEGAVQVLSPKGANHLTHRTAPLAPPPLPLSTLASTIKRTG